MSVNLPILIGLSLSIFITRAVVHDPAIIEDNGKYYIMKIQLRILFLEILEKHLQNHLNGLVMMMEILQEENMLYGLQIHFIIQIIFGLMEVKVLTCFIMLPHQLGVVHALDS